MTIDTTSFTMAIVKVQPFKANFMDETNVSSLSLYIINDNLKDACSLGWQLLDDRFNIMLKGSADIVGDDYKNWDGDNQFPFTFILNKLNLTAL